VRLTGLEVQPSCAVLAQRNGEAAGATFEVITGDAGVMPQALAARSFDHVMTNPPYFDRDHGTAAPDAGRDVAMGEGLSLAAWLDAGLRRLRPGGSFTMIHRMERLPDTLSGLWAHPAVSGGAFRDIMRFLLSCVTKDKHIEGLLDKLAHRFEAGDDVQVWRATAYCLAQLAPQLTEKGIRRLVESFRCYKRWLGDAPVAQHFSTLVAAAGKLGEKKGGEMAAAVEEWKTAVVAAAAGASEDGDVAKRAAAAKGTKAARDAAAGAAAAAEAAVVASLEQRRSAAQEAAADKAAGAKAARAVAAAKRKAAATAKKRSTVAAAGEESSDSDVSLY
jgi:hypothetical protein